MLRRLDPGLPVTRYLRSQLFGLEPTDPTTFAASAQPPLAALDERSKRPFCGLPARAATELATRADDRPILGA